MVTPEEAEWYDAKRAQDRALNLLGRGLITIMESDEAFARFLDAQDALMASVAARRKP